METELEKEINLGASYPYGPLKAGECVVSSFYQSLGLQVGDQIELTLPIGKMLATMAETYNRDEDPQTKAKIVKSRTKVNFPCTIAGFIS